MFQKQLQECNEKPENEKENFMDNKLKETNNRQTNTDEQNKRVIRYADYISAMKKKGTKDERQ